MKWLAVLSLAIVVMLPGYGAAQQSGRVRRPPPTAFELERMAVESALTDSTLSRGDIIVTDRGFMMFRGYLPDGFTPDFVPIANPLANSGR